MKISHTHCTGYSWKVLPWILKVSLTSVFRDVPTSVWTKEETQLLPLQRPASSFKGPPNPIVYTGTTSKKGQEYTERSSSWDLRLLNMIEKYSPFFELSARLMTSTLVESPTTARLPGLPAAAPQRRKEAGAVVDVVRRTPPAKVTLHSFRCEMTVIELNMYYS